VLAVSLRKGGVSGRDLIAAVAVGQDLFARLRCNVSWKQDWNLSTVLGTFAATAAAGRVLRLTPEQLTHAFGVASMQAGGVMELVTGLGSQLGGLYAGFPAIALIWLRSDPRDPWLALVSVVFLIVIVATADTAAFLCGRLLRGPLLWPQVSPKKTWSGLVGAVGASAVIGALFSLAVSGGSAPRLAAIGAALALIAQAGDLAESALKRRFGAKDAGSILPGHGGVMDRVDGLIAAASAAALAAAAIDMLSPARALLLGS